MIGAAITAALPVMRAHAASLRTLTCTIERHDGTRWTVVHTGVACHLDEEGAASRTIVAGETVTPESPVLQLAHDVTGIEPDDRVAITGRPYLWVTRAALDDATHPVEMLVACRWQR